MQYSTSQRPSIFWTGKKGDVFQPAVQGTLALLEAAYKYAADSLQMFVYMSSLVTLLNPSHPPSHHYTSLSWNDSATCSVSALADDASAPFCDLYPASKVLAERAVFSFRKRVKPSFGIASVIPGVVIGPPVLFPERAGDVNGTIKPVWEVLSGENRGVPRVVGSRSGAFVDVRDLVGVCAGLLGFEGVGMGEVDGKRVIIVAGKADTAVMGRALVGKYPERLGHLKSVLEDGRGEVEGQGSTFDTDDAEKALGRPWTTYEKSVLDTAEAFERYLGKT